MISTRPWWSSHWLAVTARGFSKTVLLQLVLRTSLILLDLVVTSPASNPALFKGEALSGLARFWISIVRLSRESFRSPLLSTQWMALPML